MSEPISRRHLLEAAGGITFLALVADGRGAFALVGEDSTAPPVFTALPYIQPGPNSALKDGAESVVLAWQTNNRPANFRVTVKGPGITEKSVEPTRAERTLGTAEDAEQRLGYAATLEGLALSSRYSYRVAMGDKTIAEGYFTTRRKRGEKCRFVSFGDNSYGDISDRMIAFQAYQARPDFVMNTGDNVYEDGLDDEYARHFFPVYNADVASPRGGAPLLRSVPFYTVIANHDVHGKDPQGFPVADFTKNPDSLAYFTAMHLPLNAPANLGRTPAVGDEKAVAIFRKAAGGRFPRMANYSFDYADAHFLCLDSNIYMDPTDAAFQSWIEQDLKGTDAPWKFVVYHHPAFNVGYEHYTEQHMRVLSPIFERYGVTMVLHGHEHNYQRTRPLKFAPAGNGAAADLNKKKRFVPGAFTVDSAFDGVRNTRANGIIYVTTGAGGKHLYDEAENTEPARWRHAEDGNVEYIARFISDRHSLTIFDMDAHSLTLTQVDQWGAVVDRCKITR